MKFHSCLMLIKILFLISSFIQSGFLPPEAKPSFTTKIYGPFANFFESENDLLNFFEFKKGDVVAEVGAGSGRNIGGMAILTDSITFYAEDINTKYLSQKKLDKVISDCKKYKNPITGNFKVVIGNEKATTLPDSTFDKILLSASIHEFTYVHEMLDDLYSKLKKGGKIYVLESVCIEKGHENLTFEETTALMQKHNLSLVKKDGKDIHGSNGLYRAVYVKN